MEKDRILNEYRIRKTITRPTKEYFETFQNYPVASISDAFRKRQTLPIDIKPVWDVRKRIAGPAITVNAMPGDEILALKAIEIAKPGDVIVVAFNSQSSNSFWGGIMSTMAKVRGVAALITDGLIRDLSDCREIEFPIWATGVTPIAPNMDVPPGDLNFPITIGKVIINPGDLVVADEDGVVIVPKNDISNVEKAVSFRMKKEEEWLKEIYSSKEMILKDNVDSLLSSRTVEFLD